MDPCNPNTNINSARLTLRRNMGVPKSYAKNFSRKMVCNAFRRCKHTNVFPPMDMKIVDGYVYLIDSNSPLSAKEYRKLFEVGTKSDIVAISRKLGVIELNKSKNELVSDIQSILSNMDILEPIKAMKVHKKKEMEFASDNNNIFQPSNNNGNNNIFQPSNNNGNNNIFQPSNNNGNRKPGRPIVSVPNARININKNGSFNNLKNFVKTPKVSGPRGNYTKNTNVTNLMKTLEAIKNELGVLPPNNSRSMRSVAPSTMSTFSMAPSTTSTFARRSVTPSVVPGAYTKNNLNRRTVNQLRTIGQREFGLPSTLTRQPGYGKERLIKNILNRQSRKLESITE